MRRESLTRARGIVTCPHPSADLMDRCRLCSAKLDAMHAKILRARSWPNQRGNPTRDARLGQQP